MKKIKPIDEEELKVPAYMRKRAITSHARQKLILTALDRKEAGVKPGSRQVTAPLKNRISMPQQTSPLTRNSPLQTPQTIPQQAPIIPHTAEASLPMSPKKLMQVGEVTHYMDNINVAIILLSQKGVKKGDILLIEGSDFIATQLIEEMQIDRKPVAKAKKGDHIGLKVKFAAEVNGKVFKLA